MVSIKPDDQFLIDPELALIFHLSGDYAMRRVEVMRAEVLDFDGPMVHVRGKGNVGQQGFYKLENLKKTTFLQGARIGTGSTCCVLDKFGCGVRGKGCQSFDFRVIFQRISCCSVLYKQCCQVRGTSTVRQSLLVEGLVEVISEE